MKQKHHRIRLNRYIVGLLALLVVTASGIVGMQYKHTEAAANTKPAVGAAVPSQFSFTGATDWWQGATRKEDMALFHKIQDSCFISIQHKTGTIDADQAGLQKNNALLVSDGYTITPGNIVTATLQTNKGQQ